MKAIRKALRLGGIRRRRTRPLLLKAFTLALILCTVIMYCFRTGLFRPGPKSWKGGQIGRNIDNSLRDWLFYRATQRQRAEFRSILGFDLPQCPERTANQVGALVLTQNWLAETYIRAKRRHAARELYRSEQRDWQSGELCQFPFRVIRPNVGEWYQPWGKESLLVGPISVPVEPLFFDASEVESLLATTEYEKVYKHLYPYLDQYQRIELFGICALYSYGGIFLSAEYKSLPNNANLRIDPKCENPWFRAKLSPAGKINWLVATPGHHHLKCLLQHLQDWLSTNQDTAHQNTFSYSLWPRLVEWLELDNWDADCHNKSTLPLPALDVDEALDRNNQALGNGAEERRRFQVEIVEGPGTPDVTKRVKQRRSDQFLQSGCSAGWFCDRCLRIPWLGSLQACHRFCRTCYINSLCDTTTERKEVVLEVILNEVTNSSQKRIPRIVHQTWFEELTDATRYPHLQRMQNSWKATGWDYRFYTDEGAVAYIRKNYPPRVLDAYKSIIPGAFKADLFRLLVLLKDGGVYTDIDVQLDVNLDHFITQDLSFFVPRDVPLDYWPDSNYCLWNGLLGASPGNPIVAKAVEDLLNHILNRQDYYDIEAELCQRDLGAEVWKLRVIPILLLTGPCALGMSVNAAVGRSNYLKGIDLGWLSIEKHLTSLDWGNTLILLADRYDLGELRFTDVERNLLVASTDPDRFAKDPVKDPAEKHAKTPIHYSKFGGDIVGEQGAYIDDQSNGETISIKITHLYI